MITAAMEALLKICRLPFFISCDLVVLARRCRREDAGDPLRSIILLLVGAFLFGCGGETGGAGTPMGHPVAAGIVSGEALTPRQLFVRTNIDADAALAGAFKPRRDVSAWRFTLPVDWEADPYNDRNWRYQLHALRVIDPLIKGYEAKADPTYLAKAKNIALDWIDHYPRGPRGKSASGEGSMAWHDMSVGLRALRFAYLYDHIKAGSLAAAPAEISRLENSLEEHAEVLSHPLFFNSGNHGIFISHGLMAICRTLPDLNKCGAYRAYARDRMIEVLESQYKSDGGHVEHSPGYHSFVLSTLENVRQSGWYQLDEQQLNVLQNAQAVRGWMADATGRYPNIGDSERRINPWANEAFGPAARCETANAEGPLPESCFGFKYLEKTGYAIMRTAPNVPAERASSIFFTCSYFSGRHKHADDLSFEWLEGGNYILVDAGKYAYHSDAMRNYVISAPAHNSLFFAEDPYRMGDHEGSCINEAYLKDGALAVSGVLSFAKNVTHRRDLSYQPGVELVVVDVVEQPRRKKPFEIRWQLGPALTVDKQGEKWLLRSGEKVAAVATLDDACDWSVLKGEDRASPKAGWYSETYNDIRSIEVLSGACAADVKTVKSEFTITSNGAL